jgi:transcriptional regulator with XRE-family HTH domain
MTRRNNAKIPIPGLPERIRLCREKSGYSMDKLIVHLGITKSAYRNYETGEAEPCLAILVKMSLLFGVSVNFLLGIKGDELLGKINPEEGL